MSSAKKTDDNILRFPAKDKIRAYGRFILIIWRANPGLALVRLTLLVAGAFLQPVEVYFFAQFIAAIAAGRSEQAPFLLGVVIVSYALRYLVNEITYSRLGDWLDRTSTLAMEGCIYRHLSALEPGALSRLEIKRSLDFVREDLWRLNRLADTSEWFVRSMLKFAGTLALALAAPFWVIWLVLADALLQAVNYWLESRQEIWATTWNSLDGRRLEYTRYLFINAREFRELKLLGAVKVLLNKWGAARDRILVRFKVVAMASLRNRLLLAMIHVVAYAIVIIVFGREAFAGPQALATLYVALNLFSLMGEALNGISGSVTRLWSDMEIMAYINQLLSFEPENQEGLDLPKEPLVIVFKNVTYQYPDAREPAIKNLNLTIRENEHLAIVGENGAGKSTLLKLLSGLIRPTKGVITLNGKDLRHYKPEAWRSAFHFMLQDAKLYQDFIKDSLLYGTSSGKSKFGLSLKQSVEISGSNMVIASLPQSYRTFIGDWAAPPGIIPHQVSGGQEQRLLISRSLIHGGRILGFDEPTSAMDANAEMKFFENMLAAAGDRGLIFVSHRFSTVRRAKRIIVFYHGQLVEQGTHDELMSAEGKYAELYRQQAKWYV